MITQAIMLNEAETVAENTKVKGEPALLVSSCMNCLAEGGMVTASETIWEAWGKQALTNLGHLADFAFGFLAGRGAGASGATNGLITRQVLSNLSKQGLKESSKRFGQIFLQTAKKELVSQFNPFGGWKGRNWICNALRGVGLYGAYKQHWDIWTDDEKSLLDKLQASTVGLILDVFAAKGMTFLCFPAGTKVHTEWGLANIESLEEGIKVLTYNEQTGDKEYKSILKTTRRITPKMCVLELSNGETLRVTPEHRFFNNGKWTPIEEFEIGDLLQTKDDVYLIIENKTIITTLVEVFNLEIEGNENYFVTIDGVLVHNGYGDANELKKIEDRGFNGVEATPNGGLNYANSDALYPVKDGQKNIITIDYSGDYLSDFQNASMEALGQKSTPRGYVWHHLDDYNSATNKGTMQLVKQEAHSGVSHIGGCSQYKEATGNSYTFKTW